MPRKAKRPTKKEQKTTKLASLGIGTAEAVRIAIAMHQNGDVESATEIYRQILAATPDHVDALHFLGVAEHQRGRPERALELMARAAELAPQHPDVHVNQGNVLKLLRRTDEAEAAYRRALEIRPDDANALNNLATIARERGLYAEAAELLEAVIAIQPDHYEAHQNMGNALAGLNRFTDALEWHKKALALRPGTADSYRQLGGMFYASGMIEEAAQIYEQWLALEPHNPVPRHLIAACRGGDAPERASDDFVREAFDRYASSFDASLARLGYRAPALVGEAVAGTLGEPRASLDVLDAGCGTGLCAEHLRAYAKRLIGVDLSARMLDRARERSGYDELVEAELTDFVQRHPAAFDLIVSADTLCYFGALEAVATAASDALRAGGHLTFTVERSDEAEAPTGHRLHPHGRYSHTEPYVRRVLGDAGLEVTSLREVELRKEAGKWVRGSLVMAKKPLGASR